MPSASPLIADINFGSDDYLRDPWTPLRALQRDQPVFWSASQKAWIVTRHEDVLATFRDTRLSASRIVPFLETAPGGLGEDFPLIRHFEDKWISNVDLPVHARLRRLMANAFSKAVVEGLRPKSRRISRDILDEVTGRDVDYVVEVARELPARVITAMFGIPADQRDQFATWASHIQQATGAAVLDRAMIELYHSTLVDMNVELLKLIVDRRAHPQDDLLTRFVRARDEDDRLSDDELLGACHATIIAGFETTMHMLTLGMIELAERPALQAHMLSGPTETAKTIDELLRYIGMAKGMLRIARTDFDWHGQSIREGDFVFGMNISANRDARVWTDPDRIDPERDTAKSVAFGPGMHFCLGHLLARMELCEFFLELFGNFEIQILSDARPWINSFTFRGLERLPVRISRKAA